MYIYIVHIYNYVYIYVYIYNYTYVYIYTLYTMTRHKEDSMAQWLQWLNAQGAHLPMADPRPVRPRLLAAVRSRDDDGWQMDMQGKP